MSDVAFHLDTREFSRTLRAYSLVSKTEPTKIVVRKAFFIARSACRLTHRADPAAIKAELEAGEATQLTITKRGKYSKAKKNRTRTYAFGGSLGVEHNAKGQFTQRIFKILAARLRKEGKPIPAAEEFRQMALRMLAARIRSVAFLAAGFLPAIRRLATLGNNLGIRGMAARENQLLPRTQKENPKLGSSLVVGLNTPKVAVTITNSAHAKNDQKNALHRYAGPALQTAFANETASTRAEIEKRYRDNARRLGIRTN